MPESNEVSGKRAGLLNWSNFLILLRRVKFSALRHPLWALAVVTPPLVVGYLYISSFYGLDATVSVLLNSILGGTIASLATYAFIRSFFLVEQGLGVKEWLAFGPAKVWIVPSYLSHPSGRAAQREYFVVPPFDAQAAHYLTEMLKSAGYRFPMRDIRGSHWFDESILGENVVTFCLPERNKYSRLFLALYQEIFLSEQREKLGTILEDYRKYVDDENWDKWDYFGLRYQKKEGYTEWQIRDFTVPKGSAAYMQSEINARPDENVHVPGNNITDWCLVVKGPNPFNPEATFLGICGIHGIGTLGGTMFINENRDQLFKYYDQKIQVHLLHVVYRTPVGASNYVDSRISNVVKRSSYADFKEERIRRLRISRNLSR